MSLPYQGRWLPKADGEVYVSDVGALRKCASGTFLATGAQQLCCEEGSCLKRNCLRRPHSFRVAEKNMESRGVKKMCRWHIFSQDHSGYAARREVIKPDLSTPLWKLPKRGGRNSIVPHNQNRNLSVLPSFSAQDAAAFWRLFGATGISPRSVSMPS